MTAFLADSAPGKRQQAIALGLGEKFEQVEDMYAAANDILARWDSFAAPPPIRPWDESRVTDSDEEVVIKQNWTEIRRFMWNYVGIVRTTKRLERAQHRIKLLGNEIEDYYGHFRVTTDLIELRNLHQCADLIVTSALFAISFPQEGRNS